MQKISMRAARVNARKTQDDLSKALGVSKNMIIDWEKGRKYPSLEQFQKYCGVIGANPKDIDCKVMVATRL